jgi:Na+/proline symporter
MFLGLEYIIWIILVAYFAGMLLVGWWSRRRASSQEGYLLGDRKFGVWMMIMHAFGAGTNPGDAAGVVTKTAAAGASGIWVSWMWMFGTPFYWLIAPVIRRLRCLTMADFFQQRFCRGSSLLYIFVASTGMAICLASVMLATTRTVQGMMSKPSDPWFFGILLVTTITFMIYGYWGGIVAAIRTDMVQGIMIIFLSFLAIPAAFRLEDVGGFSGMLTTLNSADPSLLGLFDPSSFKLSAVILLCINAPLTALALPHLVSVCGAGKTEWEGRMGFTCGNMLKRVCTIGWSLLALAWLAHLLNSGTPITPETAFGDAIRALLSPPLQGLMLACVMAAAMSSGDAFQVTVAGLFSQNIYKEFINPAAEDKQVLKVTKVVGLLVVIVSLVIAILMRESMVRAILDYFNILGLVGISIAMGLVWRRMNSTGMFACTLAAVGVFIVCRYGLNLPRNFTVGMPLLAGVIGGVIGSLLTRPPDKARTDAFFRKIHTPIGEEHKLELPLDEAVPKAQRLLDTGGFFVVKPTRQDWVGFVVFLGACVACVFIMLGLLAL